MMKFELLTRKENFNVHLFPTQHMHDYFAQCGFALTRFFFTPSSFKWTKALLITEPDAQLDVAGLNTCHLMMKTFANSVQKEGIRYSPWDTTSNGGKNYTENLKFYIGFKYTSKCAIYYNI